jgi:DNA-directed RNA polymerase specialized sigma24 family protein
VAEHIKVRVVVNRGISRLYFHEGPERTGVGLTAADDDEFATFMLDAEPRLRRALVAAFGSQRGREATAESLAWGWEHWTRVRAMDNPVGYLYRVGRSQTRDRRRPVVFERADAPEPWVEPYLGSALAALSERQRLAVVLVHGYGWTLREVAELAGIRVTSVQNHVDRGLRRLRDALGVEDHA